MYPQYLDYLLHKYILLKLFILMNIHPHLINFHHLKIINLLFFHHHKKYFIIILLLILDLNIYNNYHHHNQ